MCDDENYVSKIKFMLYEGSTGFIRFLKKYIKDEM